MSSKRPIDGRLRQIYFARDKNAVYSIQKIIYSYLIPFAHLNPLMSEGRRTTSI